MAVAFLFVVVAGFAIGVLSALLGIGGGVVMIPLFRLALGLSALQCTATSLMCLVLTSVSGATVRIRKKLCVPKLGVAIGLAGACTSPLGVWLAGKAPSWLVMATVAAIITYSAFNMFLNSRPSAREGIPPEEFVCTGKVLVFGAGLGALAGVAAGFAGLGGGFIIVPLSMQVLHLSFKGASGTSLVSIMAIAFSGLLAQVMSGNVVYWVGLAIALGAIPGAFVGGRLVNRFDNRALCRIFCVFLLVCAVLLVVKEACV